MDSKMLHQTVKSILLKDWDPIGIGEFEEAHDEYDAYIAPVCTMIIEGKSDCEIYNYLRSVVDAMCLEGDEEAEQAVAEKLAALHSA